MVKPSYQILAIIPARGGSKVIPRKNIKLLNGHPLIAYSITAGINSKNVNRTIVSTDDKEIAEVARYYGAEAPFLRPDELAKDDTPDLPVFEHALDWLDKHEKYRPDIIVQLRPTSPVRPINCVDEAVSLLLNNHLADSVRSVIVSNQNAYKMWSIKNGFLMPIIRSKLPEAYNIHRQKLPVTFWQPGHIDVIRHDTIVKKHSMTGKCIKPIIIDPDYAVDLDSLRDWEFTEWYLTNRKLDIVKPDCSPIFLRDISMLVLDFDGVFTDNRVYITEDGKEAVACDRSDGLGLVKLIDYGIKVVVLSAETNSVVSSRCKKLNLTCYQGISQKDNFLKDLISKEGLRAEQVVYLGNDVNDLGCMRLAGWSVAVVDAQPEVLKGADFVLSRRGGEGAIRELCNLIMSVIGNRR